jgi:phage terminase large subunit-like protein
MFGLRLGQDPRCVVTTTPKPIKVVKDLLAREGDDVLVTRGSMYDNADNLAPAALDYLRRRYEGTYLGQQELHGVLVDEVEGALFHRADIDQARIEDATPDLVASLCVRVVVAIDPAVTSGENADDTGIVVAGRLPDGDWVVIEDATCHVSPDAWARRAIDRYHHYAADRIIAEANQGGDLVETTIRNVDRNVSFKKVTATRGKRLRAEPISAVYEQHRVHHVGVLGDLEDQMCTWVPPRPGERTRVEDSPDRLDALVWALTELEVYGQGQAFMQAWDRMAGNKPTARRSEFGLADDELDDAVGALVVNVGSACSHGGDHQWGPAVGDIALCVKCGGRRP